MIELLAPAGSPEGVRAAVQAGANAVYMGFGRFHARRGAKGFSADEMADAIAYCRGRGVKTNITLNILTSDRECDQALQDARFLYEAGADALIVQDIGLAQLLHRHAPDLALHASTQLTIHTLDGAIQARNWGFSRVVLARECPKDAVRTITRHAGIETEVFIHGALCMCYSGQCYLSAMIGQRSGNRGLCAQPCRLPYRETHLLDQSSRKLHLSSPTTYPLSLKDLSLAEHIAELEDMGVASLKIEGRMKRPEYTAIVTSIYAALLRERRAPTPEERETLRLVFSRDGFTAGYWEQHKGNAMFGTKTEIPLAEVQPLYQQAAQQIAKERPLIPVTFRFTAQEQTGVVLLAEASKTTQTNRITLVPNGSDRPESGKASEVSETSEVSEVVAPMCMPHDSIDCVSVTAPVERAQKQATTPEMVEKALRKTGGTPFYVQHTQIALPDGLRIPAATLNALRRDALDLLLARRSAPPATHWQESETRSVARNRSAISVTAATSQPTGFRGWTASVRTREQAEALRDSGLLTIYVPLSVAAETGLPAILPRVFSDAEQPAVEHLLQQAIAHGTDTVLIGNIGHIRFGKRFGCTLHGDFGLNAWNSATLRALAEQGIGRQTLSFELRLAQIRDLVQSPEFDAPKARKSETGLQTSPLPETELIIYGFLPLMLVENCVIRRQPPGCPATDRTARNATKNRACERGATVLTDRRNETFRLLPEYGCRNTLLNSKALYLRDGYTQLGVTTARLLFTVESPEECAHIAQAIQAGQPLPGDFTKGLYQRGVE